MRANTTCALHKGLQCYNTSLDFLHVTFSSVNIVWKWIWLWNNYDCRSTILNIIYLKVPNEPNDLNMTLYNCGSKCQILYLCIVTYLRRRIVNGIHSKIIRFQYICNGSVLQSFLLFFQSSFQKFQEISWVWTVIGDTCGLKSYL